MTSRQARRERRAAERKAAKLARKAAMNHSAPPACLEEEFSPEFIAEACAARERVRNGAVRERIHLNDAETRTAINRANAAHSTGPATPEGKLACTENIVDQSVGLAEAR